MNRKIFWYGLLVVFVLGFCALILYGAQLVRKSGATTVIGGCDPALVAHVYNPHRLQTHEACATVTGIIVDASHGKNKDGCRHEADGDGHCFLKLDAGQESYLNEKNIANEDGALVFEPMCRYRVTQADAKNACKNWKQKLALPSVGSHVRATGVWVLDTEHGHNELHPISSIEVLKEK